MAQTTKLMAARIAEANEGVDAPTIEGVARARIPTRRARMNCSIRVAYIPAFIKGIAQQQYSLGFMRK
jgi:hypothetical protein